MVQPFIVEGRVTSEENNQSFPGLIFRLTTHSPSRSTYVNDVYTPTAYHNLCNLDPDQARWLIKGCMAGFALLVVWTCRTPTSPRQGWRLAGEFSLVVLGMLLFSERTWKHHCVTLVLPYAVLTYFLAAVTSGRGVRVFVGTCMAASVVLIGLTSPELVEKDLSKLAQVYGGYVLAHGLLVGALSAALRGGCARTDQSALATNRSGLLPWVFGPGPGPDGPGPR
jgi:hypothetical protein